MHRLLLRYALFVALVATLALTGCKKKQTVTDVPPETLGEYVYAYTNGVISRADDIRLRFANAPGEPIQIGGEAEASLITFDPAIEGTATWEDDRTLLFRPDAKLPSGKKYIAAVDVASLYPDAPEELREFRFDFRVREQFAELEIDGIVAVDRNDLTRQSLSGRVFTADVADEADVQASFVAMQGGEALPVSWNHVSPRVHEFTVENVSRGQQPGEVRLNVKPGELELAEKAALTVEIPPIDEFKITGARVITTGNKPYVRLHFSDPLDNTQNPLGLLNISGYSGRLTYNIDNNHIDLFPAQRLQGSRRITVNTGLKNINGREMFTRSEYQVEFTSAKPALRLAGSGVILPSSDKLIFPFEAVSLDYVELEIFKIYQNNVLQFLQANSLDTRNDYQLDRVGRVIYQQKVALQSLSDNARPDEWSRYAIDLSEIIDEDPEAIYQVRLGFRPGYSSYYCAEGLETTVPTRMGDDGEYKSIFDYGYYGVNGRYDGFNYRDREDPCKPAYYNSDNFERRNMLVSNIGLTVKQNGDNNDYYAAITDLRTAKPMSGVELKAYDYQQQLIGTATTDGEGEARFSTSRKAFFVVAGSGKERGYLRLQDGQALSTSKFEVSGVETQKGMKGYLYGERGVWRPGDSMYFNFVLEDVSEELPEPYPVTFELYDARNQLVKRASVRDAVNRVYAFYTDTRSDAPTGTYRLEAKAGGATFTKYFPVETIKPNRLKIKLDFDKKELRAGDQNLDGDLQVNWLHGAPGRNLRTKVEVQLQPTTTTFDKYPSYVFDDPARPFSSATRTVFDKAVAADGSAKVDVKMSLSRKAPGKLRADFKSRAFEQGGDFSTSQMSIPYSPYTAYAGIDLPTNKYGTKRLDIGKKKALDMVLLDADGQPVKNRMLSVGIYRIDWRWWWESSDNNVTAYNSTTHTNALSKGSVRTGSDGKATYDAKVDQWGRYLVRVCDEESGHCTGDYFYAGYPWYGDDSDKSAASILPFTAEKDEYSVGEQITVNIPAAERGRALITLENGSRVVESFWKDLKKGDNTFKVEADAAMAPTIYVHVSLIQPHAQTDNDLPIRMYGVIPVDVKDPATILKPTIAMPDELAPEQTVSITVGESTGKDMTYTLAVVDDGLLDLTNFKTPNPWDAFYAREALGVKTWDVYDYVLGAFGGEMSNVLSIGGGAAVKGDKSDINRFPPVVRHIGPFYLKGGTRRTHQITLPNYIGSVRTMVVASNSRTGAYGNAEKTTAVKKPLMLLATVPRVLGPGETFTLPVNVFAMDDKVRDVSVKLNATGPLTIKGGNTRKLTFRQQGDDLAQFEVEVQEGVGKAVLELTATGGGERATQRVELLVRNPNPYITNLTTQVVQPGETWSTRYEPAGTAGTNTGTLEVSAFAPLNLGSRLDYLLRYPHGCVEQTTSSGFPQLYVGRMVKLDADQQVRAKRNVQATIDRLRNFQNSDGSFSYWPGQGGSNHWGTNYAGHFLVEAKAAGYQVPSDMLSRWKKYQASTARRWNRSDADFYGHSGNQDLMQAYRLYGLAVAGAPEKSAMNQLRNAKNLSNATRWRLAAAYAASGNESVARQLISGVPTTVEDYRETGYTYGSDLRDEAMILETMTLLKDADGAASVLLRIAEDMGSERWYSTQTTAYTLLAIGKYLKGGKGIANEFTFAYQVGGEAPANAGRDMKTTASSLPVYQVEIPVEQTDDRALWVRNTTDGVLFVRTILTGQPLVGAEEAKASHLSVDVRYLNNDGKPIDISTIPQGTDFVAEVKVSNPATLGRSYQELALSQIFPSGWEIINARISNVAVAGSADNYEYRDYRDDRVFTYFDLGKSKSVTYRVQLNAAYSGRFYMPAVQCAAMYDNRIQAQRPGQWVEVGRPEGI